MRLFLKTKAGQISAVGFVLVMAFALHRVATNRSARAAVPTPVHTEAGVAAPERRIPQTEEAAHSGTAPGAASQLSENVAYLDAYYESEKRAREDRDRQGNPIVRRENPGTPSEAGRETFSDEAPKPPPRPKIARTSLRLRGRSVSEAPVKTGATTESAEEPPPRQRAPEKLNAENAPAPAAPQPPRRFNPYGSVLKCELVFTIDSTNEQTPLVGIVMEPVYNNGHLVIPAGAELHGVARPDRLRDRIFSGMEWVLVFPRENHRPNGRQLSVKGVALNRVEPAATGFTWGITDGSFGLEGKVIRTLDHAEIKRFVATFLGAASVTLQERETGRSGERSVRNTPGNAALQGLAANFDKIAQDVTAEIAQHGVFIRVPAGHQFYFYPMQVIDPDAAGISSDIAAVR